MTDPYATEGPLLSAAEYRNREAIYAWRDFRDAVIDAAHLPQIVDWLSRRLNRDETWRP